MALAGVCLLSQLAILNRSLPRVGAGGPVAVGSSPITLRGLWSLWGLLPWLFQGLAGHLLGVG